MGCEKELNAAYTCQSCGGNIEVVYDYERIKKTLSREALEANHDRSIWRYLDILPLESDKYVSPLFLGSAPLYKSRKLGNMLGINNLYLKDDTRNPSASFKDRASAIVVARALEQGETIVTGASTGNAASSLACLAAAQGLKTIIFVPQTAPQAKITQLLVFGATVITVKGTYDQAFDLCLLASKEYGWYCRNTGFNPFTREGKKTCSFEIIEQLGFRSPDKVIIPTGDGNILTGIWKGFLDFYRLGIIDKLPAMVAVQAQESCSIKNALESDLVIRPVSGRTIADSIGVSVPRDGVAAVKALKESRGFAISVSDQQILDAIPLLARTEGLFAEPAAAASVAGLKKAMEEGRIKPDETVVALITGNGLKDIASAIKSVGQPYLIDPTAEDLKRIVHKLI